MGLRFLAPRLRGDRPNERQRGARFALLTLSAINMLNYADRYVPSAVKEPLKQELGLSDVQTSLPATSMVLVYMLCAPVFGLLADRNLVDRRVILSVAICFWSLATGMAGLAQNFSQLMVFRALVGVGEAAYMAIAPPMISDFYPRRDRNMAYMVFSLAMPLGGATGFGLGAVVGDLCGWRAAFFVCGFPGVFAALAVLLCEDPVRGINDEEEECGSDSDATTASSRTLQGAGMLASHQMEYAVDGDDDEEDESDEGGSDLWRIVTNKPYVLATLGMASNSFAVGGFADWYDTYLLRSFGISLSLAGMVLSAATALGGIVGSVLGSKTAEAYELKWKSANFAVPALFAIPAVVFAFGAINLLSHKYLAMGCIIVGEIFFFTYGPPMTNLSVTVMPVKLRARASGLQILFIHILGDLISPPIIGTISDRYDSLQLAMQLTWIALSLSIFYWWLGYQYLAPLPTPDRPTESGDNAPTKLRDVLCGSENDESDSSK